MGQIHTTAGLDLWFDPLRITMIVPGAAGGSAIYGITTGAPEIAQAPTAFLRGLGIEREFAQLTRPGNSPVWIRAAGVACVRKPLTGEYPPTSPPIQAVVNPGAGAQGVVETVEVAVGKLRQAGAGL